MLNQIVIPFSPYPWQQEIYNDPHRFKVVVVGRQAGKTILALNALLREAILSPNGRSWFCAPTYRQVETIVWRNPQNGLFKFLPKELIKKRYEVDLIVELVNGHVMEFKGTENEDRLRGVGLNFLVLDELGFMRPHIFSEVFRPMLTATKGKVLAIGTPAAGDSPDLRELYELGQTENEEIKSWRFPFTISPHITPEEAEKVKASTPEDIYDREYLAKFVSLQGLIYDNFSAGTHLVPAYSPSSVDYVVCSIDPGLRNPTGALWTAWQPDGTGIIFKEYYRSNLLARDNGMAIRALWPKVDYFVVDRKSIARDPTSGISVFEDYRKVLKPIVTAPNDPGSVLKGIDEVKKLLHVDPRVGKPKLYICKHLNNTIHEIRNYAWYSHSRQVDHDPAEKPRKYQDHLMDAMRNMVLTKPWMRKTFTVINTFGGGMAY